MLAFAVEVFVSLLEMAFSLVGELVTGFFFPDFAGARADRKSKKVYSDEWFIARIVILAVIVSIFVTGFCLSTRYP